jgi:nucleoside-diphosphate-sugar epimerase
MIFITGGSGFIGRYLIPLLEKKYDIIIFDIKKPDFSYKGIYTYGNLLDTKTLVYATKKAHIIIHLAAKHNDVGSINEYYETNLDGTKNIISAAIENNINKIIFFSSVAVYGNSFSHADENSPLNPESHYGKSKLEAEKILTKWAEGNKDRKLIIIRPAVIIGPYNYGNMFRLMKQIDKGLYAHIGKGDSIKSLAYVENIAEAAIFLLENSWHNISIYNYSDEPQLTIRQIANIIKNGLSKNKSIVIPYYLAYSVGLLFDGISYLLQKDISVSANRIKKIASTTHCISKKIRNEDFSPSYTSIDGLNKMIEWYKSSK